LLRDSRGNGARQMPSTGWTYSNIKVEIVR
jgi:hypothetical protein